MNWINLRRATGSVAPADTSTHIHMQKSKTATWSVPGEENRIIKLLSLKSPPHFSTRLHPALLFFYRSRLVCPWGGRVGGVSRWSTGEALMLVGAHSTGQDTVLHLVPRLCINSTPVTIYGSRPSSIWCTERGTERVLLSSHQSEANLWQSRERGGDIKTPWM